MNNHLYTSYEGSPDGTMSHFSHYHEHSNRKDKTHKSDIICIDSRERSVNLYPNPESYKHRLPKTYKNIVSIELIDACIPVSQYAIDIHNNNLDISYSEYESGANQTITIPPGNYIKGSDDVDNSLSKKMKEMLESTFSGSIWSITHDPLTGKIKISVDNGTFVLNFNTGPHRDSFRTNELGENPIQYGTSIRSVLGFQLANLTSSESPNASVAGTSPVDLDGSRYIIIHVNDYDRIVSEDSGVMNGFAKIALNTKPFKYIENADKKMIRIFESPLSKLTKLEIKFSTFGNKYYNFNGLDHSLTFRIIYLD